MDVERGAVLVADDADAIRRPASLVKLMSAYVAFAALEIGDVTEEEIVTISARAAGQPPVKLRLRAGQKVPFGDLLAAMAIGSKNDAAVAVAEAVAKSEDAFVARMNDAAEKLGMVNTRYANASGLPASGQRTTARDVAILALALLTDHPERSLIFSERRTRAAGRGVTTTNPLFGRVPGAQGMKTGFTCAAGYNIAGLVEREGRRVLAVTLGHPGKSARLRAVKALIEKGFKALGTDEPLGPGLPDATPPPNIGGCSGAAIARADPSSDKPDALEKNDAYIPPARPGSGQKIAILPVPLPVLPKKAAPPAPATATAPIRLGQLSWGVFQRETGRNASCGGWQIGDEDPPPADEGDPPTARCAPSGGHSWLEPGAGAGHLCAGQTGRTLLPDAKPRRLAESKGPLAALKTYGMDALASRSRWWGRLSGGMHSRSELRRAGREFRLSRRLGRTLPLRDRVGKGPDSAGRSAQNRCNQG